MRDSMDTDFRSDKWRVLLVEDEDSSAARTERLLRTIAPACHITLAKSRTSALDCLQNQDYDLVLCDLRIPTHDSGLGADETHGLAVHAAARSLQPGTPLIFLTNFATKRNVKDALSQGGIAELYGIRDFPVVQLAEKDMPGEAEGLVRKIFGALSESERRCELETEPANEDQAMLIRATQAYARRIDADNAVVHFLSGLSGGATARVSFTEGQVPRGHCFVKILPSEKGLAELRQYERHVAGRLDPGTFAPAISPITHGLRGRVALISTLADSQSRSLFELFRVDQDAATATIQPLREAMTPWLSSRRERVVSVKTLRQDRVSDDRLFIERLAPFKEWILSLLKSEEIEVPIDYYPQHGDLHGENILVDRRGRPVMIDFGDCGDAPSCLDPVTLEMSVLFHKDKPVESEWLSELSPPWSDTEKFAASSPCPEFIRACRSWAEDVAGARGSAAMGYAHAMRQLKYEDVDPARALTVAASALARALAPAP